MGWQPVGKNGHELHDNEAGEINALSEVSPATGDYVLGEDASDSFNKVKFPTSSFGGGGGGDGVVPTVSVVGRLYEASSADTEDDEYRDASPAGTTVTVSGAQTITVARDRLSVLVTSDMADSDINCQLIARTMSVGDIIETAWTGMSETEDTGSGFMFAGPLLTDGTTSGSNAAIALGRLRDEARGVMQIDMRGGTLTSISGTTSSFRSMKTISHLVYQRIEYEASNTFRGYISPDGISWIDIGSITTTFTPTHFGVGWSTWNDTMLVDRVASFEYVRVK